MFIALDYIVVHIFITQKLLYDFPTWKTVFCKTCLWAYLSLFLVLFLYVVEVVLVEEVKYGLINSDKKLKSGVSKPELEFKLNAGSNTLDNERLLLIDNEATKK